MKKLFLLSSLFLTQLIAAQEADVKKSISTFFEGMHASDTLKIKSVCHDSMSLQSVSEGRTGTKLTTEKASEFYKSIAEIPAGMKIEERLREYKIQIDGAIAHAWTPYEFYINGKLSHKGVNSFQLFKDNGVWKIIYIVDTRRK
jgi:hypothetical protein